MAIEKRQKKNGISYCVRVRDSFGRLYPSKSFKRLIDAQREERRLLTLRDNGSVALEARKRNMAFREYWDIWSAECRIDVSPGWRSSQDQMARDYILPYLNVIKLGEVRPIHIGKIFNALEARGLASQTRLHVYNLLNKMFMDCKEHYEFLCDSPMRKRYRPKVHSRKRNFLKPDESRLLLIHSRGSWIGPAIWIGLLSGLRPGEIQALRVSDLDFENSQIYIQGTYSRKSKRLQEYPKQKDFGMSPMPPELKDYLLQCTATKSPHDFVVESARGGMLSYHSFHHALKRLCAEIAVMPVTPHELRHSSSEIYIEVGATETDVGRLLNQRSPAATKRYIHRTPERLNKIASQIAILDGNDTNQLTLRVAK